MLAGELDTCRPHFQLVAGPATREAWRMPQFADTLLSPLTCITVQALPDRSWKVCRCPCVPRPQQLS